MPLANACPDAPRIENAVMFVPKSDSRKISGPRLRPARKYCSAAPPDDEPDRPPKTPIDSTTARYAKTTPAAIIAAALADRSRGATASDGERDRASAARSRGCTRCDRQG